MFCSPAMLIKVGGVVDKYFDILNTIRWVNTGSMSFRCRREELRQYLNPSEEIICVEQFVASSAIFQDGLRGNVFEPIRTYLDSARIRAGMSPKQCSEICGNQMVGHYFTKTQWALPTEANYNKLKQHMDLKPYEEIKT